jgi:hypothetical protein
VEEGVGVGFGGVLEVALIPDGAFVVEELGALGVPVAGNFEGRCIGEVVILRVAGGIERGVHEEAIFAEILMEVIEAGGVLVDDDVPVAVEGGGGAVIDIDEEGGVGLGLERQGGCEDEEECGEEADWGLRHSRSPVMVDASECGEVGKRSGDMILRSLNKRLFSGVTIKNKDW